ncbi:suppressor of fused domain protein [Ralstonia pseudosolanacearum]|uniref:suppressor of fused domain protein n=1 Tax=Ralstonia pseudosolanacearum TaxID=1310165 RepID=UPI00397D1283
MGTAWSCDPASPRVLDVLFSTSRLYTTTAGNFQTGSKKVHWLLAVPISDAEHAYLRDHGLDALERAFEDRQIDIFDRETLINGVREWNREPSCSRFPHRGKEVPIEHVFRRFRVVPGALCALRTECFQGWPATVSWRAPDWRDRTS